MKTRWWIAVVIVTVAFAAGYAFRSSKSPGPEAAAHAAPGESAVKFWTCSMHPQVHQPEPGKCPICAMDLIPVTEEVSEDLGPRQVRLSAAAEKLAEVEARPVERRFVTAEVRMVGKVDYDETRLSYIAARVPGRLDRLYVDYTGITVREGDHLVYLYSPELLAAQEELIQAVKTASELQHSESSLIRERSKATAGAAREKLRLYGLTAEQVGEIEASGAPSDHLTIYAPVGGIVIKKNALEGMYVQTGTKIYTIADLSRVWVKLDAYESDLAHLRYGQTVTFESEAYPGEAFEGKIAFIDPVLNEKTRTVKVRVNVENADARLKPGMFVRAAARAQIAAGGGVLDPDLAGKWISPMHPEVVKDGPGTCDVCGMPLVTAESLGYAASAEVEAPLVVPASAALLTGKRAVVYVKLPDRDGVYEGREVALAGRAGDYYVVESGLAEGEQVVVRGNFKIDSEIQIHARPSMMNPEGGGHATGHAHHVPEHGQAAPPSSAAPAHADHAAHGKPQTVCPVMGGEINRDIYADYNGYRVYFCCAACVEPFQKEPEKYIEKLRVEGVEIEKTLEE